MSDTRNAHRTVVVGTGGPGSSLRAVAGQGSPAGIVGRLLGSVPDDATLRSRCDVLDVHTTG